MLQADVTSQCYQLVLRASDESLCLESVLPTVLNVNGTSLCCEPVLRVSVMGHSQRFCNALVSGHIYMRVLSTGIYILSIRILMCRLANTD